MALSGYQYMLRFAICWSKMALHWRLGGEKRAVAGCLPACVTCLQLLGWGRQGSEGRPSAEGAPSALGVGGKQVAVGWQGDPSLHEERRGKVLTPWGLAAN